MNILFSYNVFHISQKNKKILNNIFSHFMKKEASNKIIRNILLNWTVPRFYIENK
jgi:hypothetical protein